MHHPCAIKLMVTRARSTLMPTVARIRVAMKTGVSEIVCHFDVKAYCYFNTLQFIVSKNVE